MGILDTLNKMADKGRHLLTDRQKKAIDLATQYGRDGLQLELDKALDADDMVRVNELLDAIEEDDKYWKFMSSLPPKTLLSMIDELKTKYPPKEK